MDLLKIIFIVVLFLFPLGEVARIQFNNGIALTANDLGVALLVIIWIIVRIKNKKKLTNSLTKPILMFTVIALVSLLINSRFLNTGELFVSFLYLLRWIFYAGMFFVVSTFENSFKRKIPYIMIAVGMVVVLIGYIQYFLYPALRNLYYLGWDEHLYRMFSSFLDPNFAGAFFVLNLLLMAGLFFNRTKRAGWVLGLLGIFGLGAVFLTYSRSAMLMLVVSLLIFLILTRRKIWLIGVISLFVLLAIVFTQFYKSEGTNLLRTNSSIARIGSSQQAIHIFSQNPIFGVGFNAYRYTSHRLGFTEDQNWRTSHSGAGTDNSFLFVLATTGIVGFLGYVYLWLKIIKENSKSKKMISIVITASVLGLFVNAFFINSLFYPFIMEWMWILVALRESK